MNQSLYKIGTELQQALEMVMDHDGEVTEEIEQALESIEKSLVEKTDNIASWVESQEDLVNLIKEKENQLKELKKKIEKRMSSFDLYVEGCLINMGKASLEGDTRKISIRKRSQVVQVTDESKLPLDYINIPKPVSKPDLKAIKKAIESGVDVPGAHITISQKPSVQYGWRS